LQGTDPVSLPGTLVLLYHRVADLERDPHGLSVRPDRFAEQCEILRRRCDVVPLQEFKRPRRGVAITFDDGYADNVGDALTILTAARLPATFFVTVGRLGDRREVWWDRLERLLLGCQTGSGTIDVEVAGRRMWIDVRSTIARERAHQALFWRLRPMRPAAIQSTLDDIEAQLGVRTSDREAYRWMTVQELQSLASQAGFAIGAHTITHPFLAELDEDEQWQEIEGSRHSLEQVLGRTVNLFSYPFGGREAFDTVTTELVRRAGYTMACTVAGGIAHADSDPLRIPRNVVGDWDAERFEQWLDRWLTAA
jgi:peptidoglycan/xylan/chitin deacetylase (PgdA/CDA1 family)